jgi:diguanylate cyclase (GGDEF)-like protein
MRSKDSRLWLYNLALLGVVATLAWMTQPWLADWPPPGVVIGFALFQLLVWQYGYPVPSMGLTSMERVPQIAAILLLPLEVAVIVNALPALLWPFLNHRYRQGSLRVGAIRAVHNACMIALMTALAGACYLALGGAVPLNTLGWVDGWAILVAAVLMQVVNSLMMLLYFWLDGRDVRRLATWSYLTVDAFFVPIGVLAALVCQQGDSATISLFVAFLILTVVSMHEIVESRRKVQSRVEALDAANSARLAVSGSRRIEELAGRLFYQMTALFRFRKAFFAIHDEKRGDFDVVLDVFAGERLPRMRRPGDEGLAGLVLRTGEPVLIDDWQDAEQAFRQAAVLASDERPGSVLMVPVRLAGKVLGVVSLQHPEPHHYSDADKHALIAIADDVAPVLADAQTFQELDAYREQLEVRVAERTAALEQAGAERERLLADLGTKSALLERQSREDVLTGLANRRQFDECMASEVERAQRYSNPLCLALIDIDHFKRINDSGGHALGDAVLVRIARLMAEHFRASDLVARIGGDEFAVVFPETALPGALAAVEQLRMRMAASVFDEIATGEAVTMSAGVSERLPGEGRDALQSRADQLLYTAKAAGRDRVLGDQDVVA